MSFHKQGKLIFQLLVTMLPIAIFVFKGFEMIGSAAESQYFVISVRDEEEGWSHC